MSSISMPSVLPGGRTVSGSQTGRRWCPTGLALTVLAWLAGCGEKSTAPRTVDPPPVVAVATVSITPASVAMTVGQTTSLEAVTKSATGAILTGRTVTWSANTPGVATIAGSTTGAAIVVTAVSPGTATFTATSEGHSVNATVTVSVQPDNDFQIIEAQWTQGVQLLNGTIPMVLNGSDAVVNVLIASTSPNGFAGQLVLTLSESTGAVVRSDTVLLNNVVQSAPTYAAPTAQFLVPAAVMRPGLQWRVQRDPRHVAVDTDASNDVYPRSGPMPLSTLTLPPLRVRFVPVTLLAHGNVTGNVSVNNMSAYLPTVSRLVPYGQLTTTVGSPIATSAVFGTPPSGGGESFWLQLLSELDVARVADASTGDTYWMGVVAPPSGFNNTAFGGFAYIPSVPSSVGAGTRTSLVVQTGWFNNTGQTADLVAHELGHLFGRRHSPCGNPSGVDVGYPTPNGSIGVAGHDVRSWSLGLTTGAAVKAASTGDLMGYCFPQWASPYTYSGMLSARVSSTPVVADNGGASASIYNDVEAIKRATQRATPRATQRATQRATRLAMPTTPRMRQNVVVVRGHVRDGQVELMPTLNINGFGTVASTDPQALHIELLGDDGRVTATHRVAPSALDHTTVQSFVAAIPLSESVASTIAAVRVSGGRTTIVRRRPPPAAFDATAAPVGTLTPAYLRPVASVTTRPFNTVDVSCHAANTVAMAVQDAVTGDILGSISGTTLPLRAFGARTVDITCSDGVRSVVQHAVTASSSPR